MSTRTEQKPDSGGGLSASTLAIASVSSVAAAYFIHTFWTGGAILGAGITPIIVAIVSESLKRPTQRFTAIREERRQRSQVARRAPDRAPAAPPPELERPDPFGIWQEDRRPRWHWLHGRALRLAIVTGVLGFAIAAFVVTSADLVFGSGDGGDRFKIVPGTQQRSDREEDTTTTTTETTETVPEETEEQAPETVPQTTPTVPPATTPPTTPTVPPPTTTPAPETPAPQTPAPEQQTPPAAPSQ